MLILSQFSGYHPQKNRPLVLTLGTFDGVHEGHQRVLKKVCDRARTLGGVAGILTFSEHPMHVLKHREPPYRITSTPHRLRLLDQMGFDLVFLIRFNQRFSRQSPETFVRNILVNQLQVSEMVLGYDSRFGRNREGRARDMARFAKKFGFKFLSVGPRLYRGRPISSTQIRSWILEGNFADVKKCLGRPYSILGDVVKGNGLGKKLGFPTANLNPHSEALPPRGVYLVNLDVVDVRLEPTETAKQFVLVDAALEKGLWGLLNIGTRPTIARKSGRKSKGVVPEIHVLNFKGNLYGKVLEVKFMKKLRDEMRFESLEALKKQIKKDICSVDKYMAQSIR